MLLQEERAGVEIRVPEAAIRQVLEGDEEGSDSGAPSAPMASSRVPPT
jgi:hypothetical protein